MTSLPRDTQAEAVLHVMREAREMGWGEVTVEVTRGGTVKATARVDGAKVPRSTFSTGRQK